MVLIVMKLKYEVFGPRGQKFRGDCKTFFQIYEYFDEKLI